MGLKKSAFCWEITMGSSEDIRVENEHNDYRREKLQVALDVLDCQAVARQTRVPSG